MGNSVKMTKSELIHSISSKTKNIDTKDIEIIINSIFNQISSSLSNLDRIEIRGFGSFSAKKRNSRTARNPKTGVLVEVPQKHVPFFTVGKGLKERINRAL